MERELLPVEIGTNSLLSISNCNTSRLFIFVHGFKGSPARTWGLMSSLYDSSCKDKADLLFYGFNSKLRLQALSNNLLTAVSNLHSDTSTLGVFAEKLLSARGHTQWHEIVFIAHSLGAALVRRMLIDVLLEEKCRDSHNWILRAKFGNFAPAHSGANILRIGDNLFKTFLPLTSLLKIYYPCLQDLEIDSNSLKQLRQDYLSLDSQSKLTATATFNVIAELDNVVEPTRFPGDAPAIQFNGKDHLTVCKVTSSHRQPLLILPQHFDSSPSQ